MLTVKLVEANNYVNERLERLNKVTVVLSEVFNSEAFENGIRNFMMDGEKTFFFRRNFFGRFIDHPFTNDEVFNLIMSGVERPGDAANNSMDLYLTLKNGSDGSVIGFGSPGAKEIFTYSTMFDGMEIPELANHYTHEWCHKLGFDHAFHRNRKRNFSVPYAVGNVMEEVAETFLGQHEVLLAGLGNETSTLMSHDTFAVQEIYPEIFQETIFQETISSFAAFQLREWRTAESLKTILRQVNTLAPSRKKTSDGTIGDASHQTRDSDHNPWVLDSATGKGVVTALDITHSHGICDCNVLADSFHTNRDSRIKYVIWNRRIMSSSAINGNDPWTWRNYGGENPHDRHIHISVKSDKASYDSTDNWNIRVK